MWLAHAAVSTDLFEYGNFMLGISKFLYLLLIHCLSNDKQTPAALHYLFRMLDMDHVGYLTTQTVQHFVESLQAQMLQYRNDLEEVNKAVFNMVQPLDPSKITLQDLINWYVVSVYVCASECTYTHFAIVI